MNGWKLGFLGDNKWDPDKFLSKLSYCQKGQNALDKNWLNALPVIFSGTASVWYKGVRQELKTWRDFEKAFKRQYGTTTTDKDIMRDLSVRTQVKNETVSSYVASLTFILSKLKIPISDEKLAEHAEDGLLPEYRKSMVNQPIYIKNDIIQ